jgi:hypothetical protein
MIVGSIAGTIYGEPRLTKDLDLVVAMSSSSTLALINSFAEQDYYVPPPEIITQEIARAGQTNLLHHASGLKIDLMFRKKTPHALSEFERKRRIEILNNVEAWVAAPEDVIIGKLRFYRDGGSEKHLVDIRGILAQTKIDRFYLTDWVTRLELTGCFAKI